MREPGGKPGTDRDRDRENGQEERNHAFGAADLMVTSGGNSDSTSAPTSQNQLDTMAPHHNRGSARMYLISGRSRQKYCG